MKIKIIKQTTNRPEKNTVHMLDRHKPTLLHPNWRPMGTLRGDTRPTTIRTLRDSKHSQSTRLSRSPYSGPLSQPQALQLAPKPSNTGITTTCHNAQQRKRSG